MTSVMGVTAKLRRVRQSVLDRRAELARRVAELDRLNSGQGEGWDQVFAHPDWRAEPYNHQGRCQRCGSAVDFHSPICEACHAHWVEFHDPGAGRRTLIFAFAALLLALIGGIGCKTLIGAWLRAADRNPDFVEFVESYLWVAGTILILVAATYAYEKLNIAPKGHWRASTKSKV
jgi:hypothetical protein